MITKPEARKLTVPENSVTDTESETGREAMPGFGQFTKTEVSIPIVI